MSEQLYYGDSYGPLGSSIEDEAKQVLDLIPRYLYKSDRLKEFSRDLDVDLNLVNYAYEHEGMPSARLRFVHRFPKIVEKCRGVEVSEMHWYIPEAFTKSGSEGMQPDTSLPPEAILTTILLANDTQLKFIITPKGCIEYVDFNSVDLDYLLGHSIDAQGRSLDPAYDEDKQLTDLFMHRNVLAALRPGNQSYNDGTSP